MLEYDVVAKRIDAHGSSASCKDAEIILDTDVNGRSDDFNPAELLLAAIAACMIKGIERLRRPPTGTDKEVKSEAYVASIVRRFPHRMYH